MILIISEMITSIQKRESKIILLLFMNLCNNNFTNAKYDLEIVNSTFDTRLYENVLDVVECERQLMHIQNDSNLRFQFLDAGLRIPKSITQGNNLEMGNYHGCLSIHQALNDSTMQGKYCMINMPANQKISFPEILKLTEFSKYSEDITFQNGTLSEKVKSNSIISKVSGPVKFRIAVCIPKSCTITEGLSGLLNNETATVSLRYEEEFCRLPNDKPWAPADYVAIVVFSTIGILTIVSTLYDLHNRFIVHRDPKSVNPLYTSFSIYTNARRLTTFNKNPNNLECVDGIRAFSMAWVIIFHTFIRLPPVFNVADHRNWLFSWRSVWITSATLAVDTFLMMSGMLLVHTNAGRLTSSKLIRNLHLFYLNRILRLFPLLAAGVLMQASFFHWMSDGPLWQYMAFQADVCRNYWWLNLLYMNNFFIPICFGGSWYLAVDMQLHILSPILLYFVLSNSKRKAWTALVAGLLVTLTASTIYLFIEQLPGASVQPRRIEEKIDYMHRYYFNTLTRAAPFIVGMMFGYIVHLCRQQKPKFSKSTVLGLWCLVIILGALSLFSPEKMKDMDHDNQTVDSMVNSFARSAWALSVAILIVVCVNGYGGPVNWFLSLQLWKLTSRISYAMYLFHYSFILFINGTYVQPMYFSVSAVLYAFFSVFSITFIVGFIATLVIDSPFSTIFNRLLGGGLKKPQKETPPNNNTVNHEAHRGN